MYILRLGLFYAVTATTIVCGILMQILCVVSQKKLKLLGDFVSQTPYRGSTPRLRWGTSVPQTPPDSQSSSMSPSNNPVRSTPLHTNVNRSMRLMNKINK